MGVYLRVCICFHYASMTPKYMRLVIYIIFVSKIYCRISVNRTLHLVKNSVIEKEIPANAESVLDQAQFCCKTDEI